MQLVTPPNETRAQMSCANGLTGMMNDPHVNDIMIPLVRKSELERSCRPIINRS